VALARALVSDPQIVLYDEPTTGLDPITTEYVNDMIVHAKERLGITSMVISHDVAAAFKVADRLAVLYDGRIAAEGSPAEVRESKDPFVQRFLSTWFAKQ
jgi:phospholipid/cholesterol/gamma-HCH transport system ATP-binding protein